MPDPDVDAMYAAGPVPQHLAVAQTPGAEMVVELMRSSRAAYVALDHGDVHLTLSRDTRGDAGGTPVRSASSTVVTTA
jgi:oxaloacetate decarboxylase alpha subunit